MKKKLIIILVTLFCSMPNSKPNFKDFNLSFENSSIKNALNYTCFVVSTKGTEVSSESGVVIKQKEKYYIFTTHNVAQVITDKDKQTYLIANDVNGKMYETREPLKNNDIMWKDLNKNIAILFLSIENLIPVDSSAPKGSKVSPAFLQSKIDSQNVRLGDQVYMLGTTMFSNVNEFPIPVLKQGIISAIIHKNTLYGSHVYFIDNIPSPGMSGGIVFNPKGEGIGIIIDYLKGTEPNQDLTLVLPIKTVFALLERAIK